MQAGYLVYKCRRCGDKYRPVGVPDITMAMISVVTRVDFPKDWEAPEPIDMMVAMHNCSDGSIGVSDLIGAEAKPETKKYILDSVSWLSTTSDENAIRECLLSDGIKNPVTWFEPIIGSDIFELPKKPTDHITLGIRWIELS